MDKIFKDKIRFGIALKTSFITGVIVFIVLSFAGFIIMHMESNLIEFVIDSHVSAIERELGDKKEEQTQKLKENIETISEISGGMMAILLYTEDSSSLKMSLKSYMKLPFLSAIQVYDSLGKPFVAVYRDEKPITDTEIPVLLKEQMAMYYESEVFYGSNKVGSIKFYYNDHDLIRQLTLGRDKALAEAVNFRKGIESNLRTASIYQTIAGSLVVLVLVLSTLICLNIIVIRPLYKTLAFAKRVSRGDFTQKLDLGKKDEIGALAEALNNTVESLGNMFMEIAASVETVNQSGREISTAVEEQSTVASQQSVSVSEITSTMEELSVSSTQIAEHSNRVALIANETLDHTKEGADSMDNVRDMAQAISRDNEKNIEEIVALGKKSKEITTVMEIINTIADQTKLIAFNAALEASSAGEAGKRFGIVAVEIRRLADNVMESTKEIEDKINEIQDAVNHMIITSEKGSKSIQEGLNFTIQTSAKLKEILEGVQATTDAAKQISLSTQQQKTASSQVVTALREIAEGSDQTSGSIKQINDICKELNGLSQNLREMVNRFKLEEEKRRG